MRATMNPPLIPSRDASSTAPAKIGAAMVQRGICPLVCMRLGYSRRSGLKIDEGVMKIKRLCCLSLVLTAGTLYADLTMAGDPSPATAPPAVRVQAREIFAHIVGIESSIGKGNVPLVAKYLAERFQAGGFADADIHILPLGETASLVVRYRGKGSGAKPIAFIAHMDVV